MVWYTTLPMRRLITFILVLCCVSFGSIAAQEITLRRDVRLARDDGSELVIKSGTVLQFIGTEGLSYIVDAGDEGELLIPESAASEYHAAFSDRRTRERYLTIAVSLRQEGILPTHARVMAILEPELAEAERDERLDSIERKLDELRRK